MIKLKSEEKFRILIAEDNPVSRRLLEATLEKWNYEVVSTVNGQEALELLQSEDSPKIAVLDWIMPEMNGIDVCREIRKQNKEPYTYIILLSAKGEKEDIVEGMDSGADDYIAKPFNKHELNVRIKAGRRIIELEQQLIYTRNQLHIQATHDALTGIWNRAAIIEAMHKEISRARREKKPIGIIMADIDHFKNINDNHGHPAGDDVLRKTAERMQSAIREYDSIGRYGGEEFLVILPGCNKDSASKIAERIRTKVSSEAISVPDGALTVTISIGIAFVDDPQDVQSEVFLQKADEALYTAKESGRNRVEMTVL